MTLDLLNKETMLVNNVMELDKNQKGQIFTHLKRAEQYLGFADADIKRKSNDALFRIGTITPSTNSVGITIKRARFSFKISKKLFEESIEENDPLGIKRIIGRIMLNFENSLKSLNNLPYPNRVSPLISALNSDLNKLLTILQTKTTSTKKESVG
jgi:hypothetical protein